MVLSENEQASTHLAILEEYLSRKPEQDCFIGLINDQYFNVYWESVPTTSEDDLSVVTTIEPSGMVKIDNILEYPEDKTFLHNLNGLFSSARGRPASINGRSISFPMILDFVWITVLAD